MSEELPQGWVWSSVGELADVGGGLTKNEAKRSTATKTVPLVTVGSVGLREIRPGDFGSVGLLPAEEDKATLKAGDILVVEGNGSLAHIGRVAMWNLDVPEARHQNHLIRVRAHPGLESRFLLEWLASPGGRRRLIDEATSAAGLYNLSLAKVARIEVPTPPPAEQRRIVAKLDALQARSRRARAALDAIPALLDRFRQSVLAAAFRGDLTADWRAAHPDVEPASVLLERIRAERKARWVQAEAEKARAKAEAKAREAGKPWGPKENAKVLEAGRAKAEEKYEEPKGANPEGLPELPEGWCWARMDCLLSMVTSGSRGWAEHYSSDGALFIRAQDINTDALILDDVARVSLENVTEGTRTRVHVNDVLVTITGANVGKTAVVTQQLDEAYVSQHVALCRPVRQSWGDFLHQWLTSDAPGNGRAQLLELAYGGGKPGLNLENIRDVTVPIPPEAEQKELLRVVRQMLSALKPQAEACSSASRNLNILNQSILAKAFRGELVPQDPNDEPASVLLERIRAERERAAPTKTSRRRK